MKIASGSSLPITSTTLVRAPASTPTTLMAVRTTTGAAIATTRPQPAPAPGARKAIARANPTASVATVATRASQVIQPTSNPIRSPNAARV